MSGPRGPLPKKNARRRNAPTIPTDVLPPEGRKGPAPKTLEPLTKQARAYYVWAWRQPAAAAWHESDAELVAEWARLKDYVARALRGEVMKQTAKGPVQVEVSTGMLAQIRGIEDRLFLSPMARKRARVAMVGEAAGTSAVPDDPRADQPDAPNVVRPERWQKDAG